MNHPGKIMKGYRPIICCHSTRIACTLTEIESKIDKRTGAVIESYPNFLNSGDAAIVKMTPTKPMVVE